MSMRNESRITEDHELRELALDLSKDFCVELLQCFQNHVKRCSNMSLDVKTFHAITHSSFAYLLQHYLDLPVDSSIYKEIGLKTFLLKFFDRSLRSKDQEQ